MEGPDELAKRLLARDRDAVPTALNLADDRRPAQRAQALSLLEALERDTPFPGAHRVGITGAPGAGKSTLLDALVRALRGRGETVAIAAVDPSSRASDGALLGEQGAAGREHVVRTGWNHAERERAAFIGPRLLRALRRERGPRGTRRPGTPPEVPWVSRPGQRQHGCKVLR